MLFLPSDPPMAWLLAKTWVRSSDFQLHQLQSHLLRGHLIAEVISVATMRSLPSLHPIYKVFCACVLSRFSPVQLCETLWTVAHQAPLSRGFSRQEYWSGLPFPPPGDLPDPGIEPASLMPPALAGRFFTTSATFQHFLILHLTALQISHS